MGHRIRPEWLLTLAVMAGCDDGAGPGAVIAIDGAMADAGPSSDAGTVDDAAVDAAVEPDAAIEPVDRFSGLFALGPEDYDVHTEKMGAGPAVVHLFVDWYGPEQIAAITADPATRVEPQPIADDAFALFDLSFRPGTTIAISWALPLPLFDVSAAAYPNIPSVRDIIAGRYDDHVRAFARAIGRLQSPVMLNLFGEFDNNAFYGFGPDGLNSAVPDPDFPPELDVPAADDLYGHYGDPALPDGPERVRDAFVRVIDLFRAEGVDVPWFMYGSSGFMSRGTPDDQTQITPAVGAYNRPEFYYPGDQYIAFVGKSLHHQDLDDLRNRFEPAYAAWGEVTDRPFFSPEFSIYAGVGETSRAALITEEFTTYFPSFDRFAGFATVDQDPETGDPTFGLVTIGGNAGEFPDEITAWIEAVVDNPIWAVR